MNYLKQYQYVSAIVKYKSMTIAAGKLGIAQSALSRYIKNLEKDLGVRLFDRKVDPIALTQEGMCYLEIGREMLALDQRMRLQLKEFRETMNASIRVGIGPSRAPYILPAVLGLFRKRDNRTNIIIYELTTDEIKQRILKNELDIAISVFDADSIHIECIELFKERILCCCNGSDDCKSPIYPGKGQLLREAMNALVVSENSFLNSYIEVQNTETAIALVKAGLGYTVVPSYYEDFSYGDGLQYSELNNELFSKERVISIMYKKDRLLTDEEQLFLQCATEALR